VKGQVLVRVAQVAVFKMSDRRRVVQKVLASVALPSQRKATKHSPAIAMFFSLRSFFIFAHTVHGYAKLLKSETDQCLAVFVECSELFGAN
jgi:hypothetical protein